MKLILLMTLQQSTETRNSTSQRTKGIRKGDQNIHEVVPRHPSKNFSLIAAMPQVQLQFLLQVIVTIHKMSKVRLYHPQTQSRVSECGTSRRPRKICFCLDCLLSLKSWILLQRIIQTKKSKKWI